MLIDITTEFEVWSKTPDLEKLIETAAQAAVSSHKGGVSAQTELSILLAGDETVRQLNSQYRGLDKPTNVLSFPGEYEAESIMPGGEERHFLLGDIVLGFETIQNEARQQHKTFKNHVSHLIVHGVLHLLGHDHGDDDTADNMERLEINILEEIGIENPYAQL